MQTGIFEGRAGSHRSGPADFSRRSRLVRDTASNTGVEFEAGNYWKAYAGAAAVENARCVPWKIFGVKL